MKCENCKSLLTNTGACIKCREKQGFEDFYKNILKNPYQDSDSYAWYSGWRDALEYSESNNDDWNQL